MHLKFKRLTQPDTFFDLKTLLLSMFLYWSHLKGTFEVAVLRAYLIGLASQHQPSTFFKTGNALYLLSAGINSWSSPSGGGWPTFRSRLCQRELTSKSRFSQDSCFMARYYVIVREAEASLPTAKKKVNYWNYFNKRVQQEEHVEAQCCSPLTWIQFVLHRLFNKTSLSCLK